MRYFNDLKVRSISYIAIKSRLNINLKPNWHSLEFLAAGTLLLICDGIKYKLQAPVIFWMERDHEYLLRHYYPDKNYREHFCIDMWGERGQRIMTALNELCPKHYIVPASPEKTCNLFESLVKFHQLDKERYHMDIVITMEKLVQHTYETLDWQKVDLHDKFGVLRLADAIRLNPFKEFDFNATARENEISLDYFRRIFRKKTGLPLFEYVRKQRILLAAEMLKRDDIRIKDVVNNYGYSDLSEFSRIFKRYFGISPRNYQNKLNG